MNTAPKKRGTGLNIHATATPSRRYGKIEPMEYPSRWTLWRKKEVR